MIESLQRVRVLGGPGSGKSYLAKLISDHTNLSYINLDDLFYVGAKKRDPENRNKLLLNLLRTEEWIIEGSFVDDWVYSTFVDSTIILVLNPSLFVRLSRVFSKFFFKPHISLRQLLSEIRMSVSYNSKHLLPLLENYHFKKKAVIFKRADDAYNYYVKETAPDLFM